MPRKSKESGKKRRGFTKQEPSSTSIELSLVTCSSRPQQSATLHANTAPVRKRTTTWSFPYSAVLLMKLVNMAQGVLAYTSSENLSSGLISWKGFDTSRNETYVTTSSLPPMELTLTGLSKKDSSKRDSMRSSGLGEKRLSSKTQRKNSLNLLRLIKRLDSGSAFSNKSPRRRKSKHGKTGRYSN